MPNKLHILRKFRGIIPINDILTFPYNIRAAIKDSILKDNEQVTVLCPEISSEHCQQGKKCLLLEHIGNN